MSFESPFWLYFTPLMLIAFGAVLVYGLQRRDALLGRFAADRLLDSLTKQASAQRTRLKSACLLLALVAIGIGLARPQYGVEWSERKSRGLDIVFVLDSSKSMLASDIRPSRLDRAKLAIIDLVERLESDRIGLIAFAGRAFLQTPPTLDYAAFRESLDAVDPAILTSGGSDLGQALRETIKAFPSDNNVKVAVLLTDGEDLGGDAITAAEEAKAAGIQVFTVGIGTPEGAYLRIARDDGTEAFIRDEAGQPVRSQLDESTLSEIAKITEGGYSRLSTDSLNQLFENVIATLPRSERASEMKELPIERFQWALSIAFTLLVLEVFIRRRPHSRQLALWFVSIALIMGPSESKAQETIEEDPKITFNRAYEALSSGDYETAGQLYESALSKSNDLDLQREALYNMGHAKHQSGRELYRSGDPQAALEAMKTAEGLFASALEMDPDDASIRADVEKIEGVRKALEDFLQQQEESEQEQSESGEQSEDSESSEDNEGSEQDSEQTSDQPPEDSEGAQDGDESPEGNDSGETSESGSETQDDASQASSGQENSPSPEDAGDSAESGGEATNSNEDTAGTDSPEASTQDPLEDIPEAPNNGEDPELGETEESPLPREAANEGGENEGAAGSAQMGAETTEGMSEAEATALLDSLQSKENLLPFIDARPSGRARETRDW